MFETAARKAAAATIAAAAILLAAACGKAQAPTREELPGGEPEATRVALQGCPAGAGEADIFVYEDCAPWRLDTYQRTRIREGAVSVVHTSGPKIIAVALDAGLDRYQWSANNSISYLDGACAEFAREDPAAPALTGVVRTADASPGAGLCVTLQPLMSKVVLNTLRCNFKGRAYEGMPLTDARVYLTNVSSICPIIKEEDFPTRGTLNTGRLDERDLGTMRCPEMLLRQIPREIDDRWHDLGLELFCYPNTNAEETAGSPFTRLVIEGKIDGRTWYWPININRDDNCWTEGVPGIERNRVYVYDICLRRTGSTDPDTPVSVTQAGISCTVKPWNVINETQEIF